jgi:hypothetical protein
MAHHARVLITALFVMLTATVSAYLINSLATMIQAFHTMPRISIYAPGASIIMNLISTNLVTDPVAQERLAVSREFMLIQTAIYMGLLVLSSIFAFTSRNPKGIFTIISSSLFAVVPGIAIMKAWAPAYFAHKAPDVQWAFLDLQSTVLQIGVSVPFYAALFFAAALILTGERPRAGGARQLHRHASLAAGQAPHRSQ